MSLHVLRTPREQIQEQIEEIRYCRKRLRALDERSSLYRAEQDALIEACRKVRTMFKARHD